MTTKSVTVQESGIAHHDTRVVAVGIAALPTVTEMLRGWFQFIDGLHTIAESGLIYELEMSPYLHSAACEQFTAWYRDVVTMAGSIAQARVRGSVDHITPMVAELIEAIIGRGARHVTEEHDRERATVMFEAATL